MVQGPDRVGINWLWNVPCARWEAPQAAGKCHVSES